MKNKTRLIMIPAVLALVVAACGDDTGGDGGGDGSDLGGRTVTVGVENAYLPFNFILAGETEGQGWDYDAWNDICERLNCVPRNASRFVPLSPVHSNARPASHVLSSYSGARHAAPSSWPD